MVQNLATGLSLTTLSSIDCSFVCETVKAYSFSICGKEKPLKFSPAFLNSYGSRILANSEVENRS